jgi:hypothetical protein
MSLVSLATFKEYLPEVQGDGSDTELQNLLNRTESVVAAYLGFPRVYDGGYVPPQLASRSYTLYIDSAFAELPYMLPLPVRPVVSVSSWHSDVERLYGSDTLIEASNYDVDLVNGRLILKSTSGKSIENGFRANKVVLTAGFGQYANDLHHAVCVYASQLQRAKQTQGKESTSQRDVTIKISPKTMPKEVKDILYDYRVYRRVL